MKQKIVVVLMNLGGPDSLAAVRPFLFNLFYDRAILNLPNPVRYLLAGYISFFRDKKARGIYSLIGGKSPILENTLIQARHLRAALEVVNALNPSKVVLLPLYPQFSTTTTKSSIEEWQKIAHQWQSKTVIECCYFNDPDFVKAHQELISPILTEAMKHGVPRILFSAHGLPQKVIDGGDPYQRQIEASVAAIMQDFDGTDFVICYQSKVGRLKWLTPTTEDELKKAGSQSTPVVVVPISFVSEHSETLVELDIDYAKKAKTWGVPFYGRVPALGDNPSYIKCLEMLCDDWLPEHTLH